MKPLKSSLILYLKLNDRLSNEWPVGSDDKYQCIHDHKVNHWSTHSEWTRKMQQESIEELHSKVISNNYEVRMKISKLEKEVEFLKHAYLVDIEDSAVFKNLFASDLRGDHRKILHISNALLNEGMFNSLKGMIKKIEKEGVNSTALRTLGNALNISEKNLNEQSEAIEQVRELRRAVKDVYL